MKTKLSFLLKNLLLAGAFAAAPAWSGAVVSSSTTTPVVTSSAPVLSGVTATPLTPQSARITWTSSVPADGVVAYGTDTTLPLQVAQGSFTSTQHSLSLTGLTPNTTYFFRARSTDPATGLTGQSNILAFGTPGLPTPPLPAIFLTSPAQGAKVRGDVRLTAFSSGTVQTASITFTVRRGSDTVFTFTDDTAPHEALWPADGLPNGSYTVGASALDALGRTATATSRSITLDNDVTPPYVRVTSPLWGGFVSGDVHLTAVSSDTLSGVNQVIFVVHNGGDPLFSQADTTPPYEAIWPSAGMANGAYQVVALAEDGKGNREVDSVYVILDNGQPLPPVVVSSPTANAPVSGNVTLEAEAFDGMGGIGQVVFTVWSDTGTIFTSTDTHAPYETVWCSTTVPNGEYTVRAAAQDAEGHHAHVTRAAFLSVRNVTAALNLPPVGTGKTQSTFLTPGLQDGVNDAAVFGEEAESVMIVDVAGRQVFEGFASPGNPVVWAARDASGGMAPSGVYIARIRQKDGSVTHQTLVIAK